MISLESGVGNYITSNGKPYSYFAGNNYLGLANHPKLITAATDALGKYGVNFSASRQTTGTSDIHLELEKLLAEFKDRQDAVVFASGYLGNRLLLHALKDEYAAIFTDSMAHPSIMDGTPKDIAMLSTYGHCNSDHLESLLKKSKNYRPLIITDGVFALTGEIAPIDQIYVLAEKYNALLIVDDAHGTGVLGENGKGTPEHFGLAGAENIYQSETMSKALGAYGGFISSGKELIRNIRSKSAFYGASTALPPPIVAAGCAALRIIKQTPELRKNLMLNAELLRKGLHTLDFETIDGITPIIPLFFQDKQKAKDLSNFLKENKIIAPAVEYPVALDKFIVRITVSTNHSMEQINNLLEILKKWRR